MNIVPIHFHIWSADLSFYSITKSTPFIATHPQLKCKLCDRAVLHLSEELMDDINLT